MKRGSLFLMCVLLFCGFLGQEDSFVQKHYSDVASYMKARQRLIEAELAMRIDAGITLTPKEEEANRRLMTLKRKEIERTHEYFPPAHSFLKSKTRKLIDQSPILEIMKRMPKGGILHVHGFVMGDFRWLIKHATYLSNCYIYQGKEEPPRKGTLRVLEKPPGDGWHLVSNLRKAADDVEEFDEELYQSITLGEEDLSQPDIWAEFSKCFARSVGMLRDEDIWDDFCRKMLRDLIDENVQYIETRSRIGDQEIIEARRKAEKRNITLPLYIHSGESNWTENENVLDAVLLDAKRIGHGITLFKHPLLMQIVKERDIAIEVCPISNQVLGYVADLRNHPAVLYINSGLPVVICPDDPSIWKCTFSYDFYAAFMAWGLDLKCLKQLAMNSLIYSAMDSEERERALRVWRKKWADFIAWLSAYPLD